MKVGDLMRVGVVDGDGLQLALARQALMKDGLDVECFTTAGEFRQAMSGRAFDLVVLGWNLPEAGGIGTLRWLRAGAQRRATVLMLATSSFEKEIVAALKAGADDYMVKPVRAAQLLDRVQALRPRPAAAQALAFGRVAFDTAHREVAVDDRCSRLPGWQFDMALYFFRHAGEVVTRGELSNKVAAIGHAGTWHIDACVSRLRSRLNLRPDNGFRLSSVYEIGYRLEVLWAQEAPANGAHHKPSK